MAAPLSQQYPALYAQWVAAGGPDDNFKAHCLAVHPPGLVVTAEDVAWMLGHVNGGFVQLKDVVAQYSATSPNLQLKALVVGQ